MLARVLLETRAVDEAAGERWGAWAGVTAWAVAVVAVARVARDGRRGALPAAPLVLAAVPPITGHTKWVLALALGSGALLALAELPRPRAPSDAGLGYLAAGLAGAALFLASWSLLHTGPWAGGQIVDWPIYRWYGEDISRGATPYDEAAIEYPPGAVPAFVLPALVADDDDPDAYRRAFEALMAATGAVLVLLVVAALRAQRASPAHTAAAVAFVGLAPLALGTVILSRYDLVPAAVAAGAVAAALAGKHRLAGAAVGLGTAVKLFPAVLLPLVLLCAWRRGGGRAAVGAAAACGLVLVALVAPVAAQEPAGLWQSVERQLGRPLQLESLGAAVLVALDHAGIVGLAVESSHGSQNVAGPGAGAAAAISVGLQLAGLVAVWVSFARGPATRGRLAAHAAAAVAVFVAFGKVFSPQFLVWLIPLVPLVRGRRGLAASALLAAALLLTQAWFPGRYWELARGFGGVESALVLVRDLVVVALAAVLVLPARSAVSTDGASVPGPAPAPAPRATTEAKGGAR